MATMRAARFDAATRELTVTEVPLPEPGPGEVRVRVRACGICLSDVHLLDGGLQSSLTAVTPGHESAGVVDAVGPASTGGTRVTRSSWRAAVRAAGASRAGGETRRRVAPY